jgi:hypothetical protein
MTSIYVILAVFLIRIAVPLLVMIGLVFLLRRLDARWQLEALYRQKLESAGKQERTWELTNCSIAGMTHQPALQANQPCWQAFRKNNGSLHVECLQCKVFRASPVFLPS